MAARLPCALASRCARASGRAVALAGAASRVDAGPLVAARAGGRRPAAAAPAAGRTHRLASAACLISEASSTPLRPGQGSRVSFGSTKATVSSSRGRTALRIAELGKSLVITLRRSCFTKHVCRIGNTVLAAQFALDGQTLFMN